MQLNFDLVLTPGFRAWLERHRPGVLRECKRQNIERVTATAFFNPHTGLTGRYRLDFPFWNEQIADENKADFDRQLDSALASVILDQHPYRLEHSEESKQRLIQPPPGHQIEVGQTLVMDADLLSKLGNGKPVMVPAKVVHREGFFVELETLPCHRVRADVDELRVWHDYRLLQEEP